MIGKLLYLVIFPIILVCFSMLFISAQPYRSRFSQHNITTMVFLMISIVLCCCFFGINTAFMSYPNAYPSLLVFTFLVASLPLVYITCLILKWIYDQLLWSARRLCYSTSRCVLLEEIDSTVHCEGCVYFYTILMTTPILMGRKECTPTLFPAY